jgi:opacity protein-like surface antigen
MVTIGIAILCAAAAADPAEGKPDLVEGLYLTFSGQAVFQANSGLTSVGGVPLDADLEFRPGFGVQGGLGYTWTWESALAASLELTYAFRSVEMDAVTAPGLTLPAAGSNDSHSIMVNFLASFEIIGGLGVYGGGGLGLTITQSDLTVDLGGGVTVNLPSDTTTSFTWQVKGGLQYRFGSHLVIFGGVNYFDAGSVSFEAYGGDNRSLALEVGLRVYF